MASSSYCFLVFSLAGILQSLLVSPSTISRTKYIDAVCQHVTEKASCIQILNAYPPAAAATNTFKVAEVVLRLGISFSEKSASSAEKAAKENPNLKKQFRACQDAFGTIIASLKSAALELKESPDTANYDVMVCSDNITMVKKLIAKNRDKASKTVMMMTLKMEKLLAIAVGATIAVGG